MRPCRTEPEDTAPSGATNLRRQAEEAVAAQPARQHGSLSHDEALALVHELQVHQIELELQNEELTQTRLEAEALRDRYADLYDFAPVGYFTLDEAGAVREANLAGAVQLGVDRGSLVGARFAIFLHPDSLPGFAAYCDRVLAGGTTEACDVSFAARAGRGAWHAQLRGRADGAGAVRLVVTDITDRRRAEEALRLSERNLAASQEIAAIGSYTWDLETNRMLWSDELYRILGLAPGELPPAFDTYTAFIYPDDREETIRKSRRMNETGEPRPNEHRIVRADGTVRTVQVNSRVFSAMDGRPMVLHGVVQDITERKEAEEALLRAQHDYQALLDHSLLAYAHCKALFGVDGVPNDYEFLEVNETYLAMTGFSDVVGRRIIEIVPGMERDLIDFHNEVAVSGVPRQADMYSSPLDRWYQVNVYSPEPGEFVALSRDITERKQAEEALREYAENLKRSNEDLERFAYVSSHDLQEPLRSIVSFSQLLERRYRGQLGEDADDYIEFIVEGGMRMQTLIQDLLAYSRVNTTKQDLRPTEMEDVMAAAERSLDLQLREAGAVITHDPLPMVLADPLQLEQVVANLVSNAIKFRRPDEPLQIHVGARRMNGFWEFSVNDNGIGIEPEYFEKIFVIFQRLHTKDAYPGTGIGLAIVKRIIDRHGGRVWAESTPGEGSTFFFTLPAA